MYASAAGGPTSKSRGIDLRNLVKVATWNVLTLAKPGYTEALCQELSRYKINLAGLTEARLTGSGQSCVNCYTVIHSGEDQVRRNGVALILDRVMSKSLVTWQAVSSRILSARLAHRHGHLTVIVAYAPTEDHSESSKDTFYASLEALISHSPPHDKLIVLGDLNAETGSDRSGLEHVIGNYGHGGFNDNSLRLTQMSSATNLAILGSWFQRKDIHRHTWLSNDGHTRKELDHILVNDRSLCQSYRVYRGAEAPANTDHRLVVAGIRHIHIVRTRRARPQRYLDVAQLAQDEQLASQYNISVHNAFDALGTLPDDVEDAWSTVRDAIRKAAEDTLPIVSKAKRPWLTADTLAVLDKKREARLTGSRDDWRRYKSMFRARCKADLEAYYNRLATDAEDGLRRQNLCAVYRTVRLIAGNPSHAHSSKSATVPVQRADGQPCRSVEESLAQWSAHYTTALNHPPASPCAYLDQIAADASPRFGHTCRCTGFE